MTEIKPLWEEIDIYTKYPSIRSFIHGVCDGLDTFLPAHRDMERNIDEVVLNIENLARLLDDPNFPTPEAYFDLENFGHFKECYRFSPDFVIKFCAERNPTVEEKEALSTAYRAGFGRVFVPSIYFELPQNIFSEHLEKEDDDSEIYDEESGWVDNPDWHDNTVFTHICIQPRCEIEGEDPNDKYPDVDATAAGWDRTRQTLNLPEEEHRNDYQGLTGLNIHWAAKYMEIYGLDSLKELSALLWDSHIYDLHGSNVGYTSYPGSDIRYPIILDWMSR